MRRMTRAALSAALALVLPLWTSSAAGAAPPPAGALTQLSGSAGCLALTATSTCAAARGVAGPESALVSPDGKFVYVGSYQNAGPEASLAAFSRNPATGALTQVSGTGGCYSADGASLAGVGTCTRVRGFGIGDGRDFAVTSDGKWAYLVNQHTTTVAASIAIFQRDPVTGVLTQLPASAGCLSSDGSSQDGPNTCGVLPSLAQPTGVTISADDRYLYLTDYAFAGPSRIHVLARSPTTGGLTEVQCLSEAPAPSGCSTGRVLGYAKSVVLSPDGRHAYSADFAHDGISIFDRDPTTGLLSQKGGAGGCLSQTGKDDTGAPSCGSGRELSGAEAMSVNPRGQALYVSASKAGGLAVFSIAADGTLSQMTAMAGCISQNGNDDVGGATCSIGRALTDPLGSTVSPDGLNLYVTELGTMGASPPQGGVATFNLDPGTGAATQVPGTAGCVTGDGSSNGNAGACLTGTGLAGAYGPTVSPDGTSVYIAAEQAGALGIYSRETAPACQGTQAAASFARRVTLTLSCSDADGSRVIRSIATAPAHGSLGAINQATGTVTYTPNRGYGGADRFTFVATDGTNTSPPTTATLTLANPPPSLTHAGQLHNLWRENRNARRRHAPPVGTTFAFTLSQPATVTLTFTAQVPGRKVKGKCVAETRANRQHRRCVRSLPRGSMSWPAKAGRNAIAFSGQISHARRLAPGNYAVTIKALNANGGSATKTLSFTIVP